MLVPLFLLAHCVGAVTVMEAVRSNDVELVSTILSAEPDQIKSRTSDGRSPLQVACQRGHCDVVDFLVRNGADVSYSGGMDSETPLVSPCCRSDLKRSTG